MVERVMFPPGRFYNPHSMHCLFLGLQQGIDLLYILVIDSQSHWHRIVCKMACPCNLLSHYFLCYNWEDMKSRRNRAYNLQWVLQSKTLCHSHVHTVNYSSRNSSSWCFHGQSRFHMTGMNCYHYMESKIFQVHMAHNKLFHHN